MMVLPGIIGKFLAYIPITVFSSLLATLFLSLSTNSSVFVKLAKNQSWYIKSPLAEMHMTPEEITLLTEDRTGKKERPASSETRREKIIEHMEDWYEKTLKWWMETSGKRRFLIWAPIIATIISFVVFAPRLV